jgi:hypothetical protein
LEKLFSPPGINLEESDDELTLGSGVVGKGLSFLTRGLDLWFNRVEGTYLGYHVDFDSLAGLPLDTKAGAGKGLSSERWSWEVNFRLALGRRPAGPNQPGSSGFLLGLHLYDRVAKSPDAGFYPGVINTVAALIGKDDYHDYYASRGWRAELELGRNAAAGLELYFARERHRSVDVVNNYSLIGRYDPSRANPIAAEGDIDRIGLRVRMGQPESITGLETGKGISLWTEHGGGILDNIDRQFARMDLVASYAISTFGRRFFFSPQLIMRLGAGWSSGYLPRQLWGAPESALGVYGPFGALRAARPRELAGTRYFVFTAEHNFRDFPFLLLGLRSIGKTGIDIIVHGGVARAWSNQDRAVEGLFPSGDLYSEIGVGIGRIWDIIRLDLNRRLAEPRGWQVTAALTSCF